MANYTSEVDNFEALRKKICESTAGTVVSVYEYFHFDKDPYTCGGDTFDFKRTVDFDMLEPEAGDFSIERTEQSGTQALKQTNANSEQALEWSQEFPIRAKYGDRLNTFLLRVLMAERESGSNGKGIVAYSNNGISYTKKVVFSEGTAEEFSVVLFFPYLKAESWPNVYLGDLTEESTVSLNVKIENFPVVQFEGSVPAWFGLPSDTEGAEISFASLEFDATAMTVSIDGLVINDPDMVANEDYEDVVHVRIYDDKSGDILVDEDVTAGTTTDESWDLSAYTVTEITVTLSYYVSDTLQFYAYTETLNASTGALAHVPNRMEYVAEKMPKRRR